MKKTFFNTHCNIVKGQRGSLLLLLFLFLSTTVLADEPFRIHRYDGFQTLPIKKGDWVFVGNSITHMHEWREALGGDKRIKNRGVSGAVTAEVLANIDEFVYGQPAKVFLGIGVNDLSAGIEPETAAQNVRKTIERIHELSPKTRIWVSNVHPTQRAADEKRIRYNQLLADICRDLDAHFISTAEELEAIKTDKNYSFDHLHLTAKGYKRWMQKITEADPELPQPLYSSKTDSQLDETITDIREHASGNSYGMRLTYFSQLPVANDDILFFGDELLHGTEPAELLSNNHIKNRATGWGGYGTDLNFMLASIPYVLHDGAQPAEIFLYCGGGEIQINDNDRMEYAKEKYVAMIDKINELSPRTKITIMALIPTLNADRNRNKVEPFNAWLQELARERGLQFIDTYSPFLAQGILNPKYASTFYLNAYGYRLLAEILAKPAHGKKPMTEKKLTTHIQRPKP